MRIQNHQWSSADARTCRQLAHTTPAPACAPRRIQQQSDQPSSCPCTHNRSLKATAASLTVAGLPCSISAKFSLYLTMSVMA